MRLAWFSPMPPVRTGVAICSAELVSALQAEHHIDVFVDEPVSRTALEARSAHDFVWLHRQAPYDLSIYQLGNSSHHDYLWPYLFRFPGLTVLHDRHVHHARAASLLRTRREADYRMEFAWNQPDSNPDLAELAIAGFDTHLYYSWPMTRLVAQASRMVAVHSASLAESLEAEVPGARIEHVRLGHGIRTSAEHVRDARATISKRHALPPDSIIFGCFGALTPDKRIPQVLSAFAATLPYAASARLVLAGAVVDHYDVAADVAARGLGDHVTVVGYVPTEDELTQYIAACDVALNLRWPTAREISGPWLRCLAAGKPTIIVDLAHLAEVPSLDPRSWRVDTGTRGSGFVVRDSGLRVRESAEFEDSHRPRLSPTARTPEPEPRVPSPVCVAIDIVDEDHSLKLAMRRLAEDVELRGSLGTAARAYWLRQHSVEGMIEDYRRVIAIAARVEPPRPTLPPHLVNDGQRTLDAVIHEFGLRSPFHSTAQGTRGGGPG